MAVGRDKTEMQLDIRRFTVTQVADQVECIGEAEGTGPMLPAYGG